MYQPGDYVVGYPDYYEDNGKRYIQKNYHGELGDIRCHEDKDVMLNGLFTMAYYGEITNGEREWGDKFGPKKFVYIHYTKFRGMVISVDTLGEKRPHWDGLVQVLVDEKLLWVFARNLKLVIFAGTKS